MKRIFCLFLFLVSFALSSQVHADIELNGEDESHMKALPKILEKKFEDFVSGNDICRYLGKPVARLQNKGILWFVVNTCRGSGGTSMAIALVSAGKVRTLLQTGAESGITIKDQRHKGFPDLEVSGASASFGRHFSTFRYNGKDYKPSQAYRDMDLPRQVEMWTISAVSGDFFKQSMQDNSCIQKQFASADGIQGYKLSEEKSEDDDTYLIASECLENGNIPLWVISPRPSPHIIFHATAAMRERYLPIVRLGPGASHGLDNICILAEDDTDSERCWRYDGATYRPLPQ